MNCIYIEHGTFQCVFGGAVVVLFVAGLIITRITGDRFAPKFITFLPFGVTGFYILFNIIKEMAKCQ